MVKRIPLEHLRISKNISVGMNPFVIMSLAYTMRSTTIDPKPPIVKKLGKNDYSITDGRHRFVAAIVAGRNDLLCSVE